MGNARHRIRPAGWMPRGQPFSQRPLVIWTWGRQLLSAYVKHLPRRTRAFAVRAIAIYLRVLSSPSWLMLQLDIETSFTTNIIQFGAASDTNPAIHTSSKLHACAFYCGSVRGDVNSNLKVQEFQAVPRKTSVYLRQQEQTRQVMDTQLATCTDTNHHSI